MALAFSLVSAHAQFLSLHQSPLTYLKASSVDANGNFVEVMSDPLVGFKNQYAPTGVSGCVLGFAAYQSQCLAAYGGLYFNFPEYSSFKEFKVYVPAGTTDFLMFGFLPQNTQYAVAVRLGTPPSRTSSITSAEYETVLANQNLVTSFSRLQAGEEVIAVHDGSGSLFVGSFENFSQPLVEGKWLYLRVITGEDIFNLTGFVEINLDAYAEGYARIVFGADGDPVDDLLPLPTPGQLTITGSETLQGGARSTLTATARYTDNRERTVTPVWSSSNPVAAAVSASGVVTAGVVSASTQVTITASWTENGVTVQDSQVITVSAVPSVLTDLRLAGANSLQSGGQVRLVVNAVYADGSSKAVSANGFTLSIPALGSVNTRGVLTVANVASNTALTVTASYEEGGVTKTASLPIIISAAPAVLSRLTLVGATALVASGQTLNLSALGVYADTSSKLVVANWQVSGTAATVSSTGVFKASTVSADTPVVVSASYTEAGVTANAQFQIIIQATVPPTPIEAEVQATGTSNKFSLALWTSVNAVAPNGISGRAGTVKSTIPGRTTYKLFVAALIPGGKIVPVDTLVTLNRSGEWQGLSFPIAEYLNGVTDNSVQLVEILDNLDVSFISGTKIYVGYGTDDQEMISSGRFRLVYQIQ